MVDGGSGSVEEGGLGGHEGNLGFTTAPHPPPPARFWPSGRWSGSTVPSGHEYKVRVCTRTVTRGKHGVKGVEILNSHRNGGRNVSTPLRIRFTFTGRDLRRVRQRVFSVTGTIESRLLSPSPLSCRKEAESDGGVDLGVGV